VGAAGRNSAIGCGQTFPPPPNLPRRGRGNRIAVLAVFTLASLSRADVRPGPEVDSAIDRALAYLARQQKPDGLITDGPNRVATTGLATLAFLAAGHVPDEGKYGGVVRNAVDALVKSVPPVGYVGGVDGSRMYGHGIVTLALAQAAGVDPSEKRRAALRTTLERMIKVILDAQNVQKDPTNAGGWRYEPNSGDSDLSLSGWASLSLRAAQNAGLNVPKEPAERAVGFIARCFKADEGCFCYTPGQAPSIAMTSVGVLDLHLLDAADRPEVARAAAWLATHPVQNDTRFFYYSLYYSTQAATQVGGDLQEQTWKNNKGLLLARQQDDGGFPQSTTAEEPGRVYATAMAALTLAVPYQMLPIYQR